MLAPAPVLLCRLNVFRGYQPSLVPFQFSSSGAAIPMQLCGVVKAHTRSVDQQRMISAGCDKFVRVARARCAALIQCG
jgi:hypothetical protein